MASAVSDPAAMGEVQQREVREHVLVIQNAFVWSRKSSVQKALVVSGTDVGTSRMYDRRRTRCSEDHLRCMKHVLP